MKILFLRPEGTEVPQIPGAEVIHMPIFKPICLDYDSDKIDEYNNLAFTSINAVKCFKDFDKIKNKKVFSIGKATYRALKSKGIESEYPENYDSISLANLILKRNLASLLAIRSKKATDYMRNMLLQHNVKYEEIYDYDLILDENNLKAAIDLLDCKVDIVVLTSSEIAKAVASHLKDNCYKIITIGPVTTNGLLSLRRDIKFYESKKHDIEGIVELILKSLRSDKDVRY